MPTRWALAAPVKILASTARRAGRSRASLPCGLWAGRRGVRLTIARPMGWRPGVLSGALGIEPESERLEHPNVAPALEPAQELAELLVVPADRGASLTVAPVEQGVALEQRLKRSCRLVHLLPPLVVPDHHARTSFRWLGVAQRSRRERRTRFTGRLRKTSSPGVWPQSDRCSLGRRSTSTSWRARWDSNPRLPD